MGTPPTSGQSSEISAAHLDAFHVTKAILRDRAEPGLRIQPSEDGAALFAMGDTRPLLHLSNRPEGIELRLAGDEEVTLLLSTVDELYSFTDLIRRAAHERATARRHAP